MALVVITGAARSGKSAAAQRLVQQRADAGARAWVAVFADGEGDTEMAARIERHRSDRPAAFTVIEAADSTSWRDAVPDSDVLLLDCLGTLTALIMAEKYEPGSTGEADTEARIYERLEETVSWLAARSGDTVVVTNETGWGVVPGYASGRLFRDLLGRANAAIVSHADTAYLALCGRLLDLAALPADPRWPADRFEGAR